MKDDSLNDKQQDKIVGKSERQHLASIEEVTQYETAIWNAAIEAAAKKADRLIDHIGYGLSKEIRELKK